MNFMANPVVTHNENLQILIADQTHRVTEETNDLKYSCQTYFKVRNGDRYASLLTY